MPINNGTEAIFKLTEAPKKAERLLGRRLSIATFNRWANKGTKGIQLETTVKGGARYTSKEALRRFLDAVAEQSRDSQNPVGRLETT